MKFENTRVFNFEGAFRGMRNPKESWGKSDSKCDYVDMDFHVGQNDMELAQKLIKAGSEHRKFMRQIFVSVDITAPLYWWKEFDTYKVGTVSNSCSTMHKLAETPITVSCFETDDVEILDEMNYSVACWWIELIDHLETLRKIYNETKDKRYWKELVRMLPESWLQKRTVTMDYENILAMCSKGQRRFHKLAEWRNAFVGWARLLPYAKELLFLDELEEDK